MVQRDIADTVCNISLFRYCFIEKLCYNKYRSYDKIFAVGGMDMGIYLNPSNGKFRKAVTSEIYVDKSDLITKLNERVGKENCNVCVSRPRRFGKSMNLAMAAAYYSKGCDSSDLFS